MFSHVEAGPSMHILGPAIATYATELPTDQRTFVTTMQLIQKISLNLQPSKR